MDLHNSTPYGVFAFVKQIEPGEPFLTVVVTGTFSLTPDGSCVALPPEKQDGPTGPQFYRDRIGNSRLRDGDGASFKPRAECLLIGSAYAPDKRGMPYFDAHFCVGPMRKAVRIVGDRNWVRQPDGSPTLEGPLPVVEMPIRNEFAHGGFRSDYNKHGKGYGELPEEPGSTIALANIVDPAADTPSWERDGLPAGLGALATELKPRLDLHGTFDEVWLYRRQPFAPEDFDMAFYNSARPDQQVDGYLNGDEEIYLENLHPERAQYRSRLPGTRVRLFAQHVTSVAPPQLVEIMTVLDTCIVDMRDETVRLVWRGTMARVESDDVEQLADLMVVEEPCDRPVPRDDYLARLDELIAARQPREGISEEDQAKIDGLNAAAIEEAVGTLRKHNADEALIALIQEQETADDALDAVMRYVDELSKKAPGGSG